MKKQFEKYLKTILLILLIGSLSLVVMSCGGGKKKPIDIAKSAAKSRVTVHYVTTYDIKLCDVTITNIDDLGDNEFEFYGKASIIDNYSDKWEAKFSGTCSVINGEAKYFDIDYDEPRRK